MLVNSEKMLAEAREGHYAIPSPDIFDLHSIRSYMNVAERLNRPIIIAYAPVHGLMMSLKEAAMLEIYYCKDSSVPVAFHLDHGRDPEMIKEAIALGFTSVMIDASNEAFSVNAKKTKAVVDYAHRFGVTVEAEIGHVGEGETYSSGSANDTVYTEPDMAARFAVQTGVDSLAVSIGTAHGKYRGVPKINFERLAELRRAVKVPLVLHGGSSSGDENLARCAQGGVCKINVYTDLMDADMAGIDADKTIPGLKRLLAGQQGMENMLEHCYRVFGCVKD
jgi:ketose-bisphosphate aldolase